MPDHFRKLNRGNLGAPKDTYTLNLIKPLYDYKIQNESIVKRNTLYIGKINNFNSNIKMYLEFLKINYQIFNIKMELVNQ